MANEGLRRAWQQLSETAEPFGKAVTSAVLWKAMQRRGRMSCCHTFGSATWGAWSACCWHHIGGTGGWVMVIRSVDIQVCELGDTEEVAQEIVVWEVDNSVHVRNNLFNLCLMDGDIFRFLKFCLKTATTATKQHAGRCYSWNYWRFWFTVIQWALDKIKQNPCEMDRRKCIQSRELGDLWFQMCHLFGGGRFWFLHLLIVTLVGNDPVNSKLLSLWSV